MLKVAQICILGVGSYGSDPCATLAQQIEASGDSYIHGRFCHGLFWLHQRGSGPICLHSGGHEESCAQRYPVAVTEAERIVMGGTSGHASSAPPDPPSTTSTSTAKPPERADPTTGKHVDVTGQKAHSRSSHGLSVVAMGDCGVRESALQPTADLLGSQFSSRDATFLLGDLFYPLGIDKSLGTSDPRLPRLIEALSVNNHGPLFPILGNHDWHGDWEAELAYAKINRKWVFPHNYYFHQIMKGDVNLCTWFLDTDKKRFDDKQASWLRSSIDKERSRCDWLVVAGHHFVFTGGEYEDNNWLIAQLLPILEEFKVHIYLAGHEHQSQVIKLPSHPTWFLTAGALGDLRDKPLKGHEGLLFINKQDVAFLHMQFSKNSAEFAFVKSYSPGVGTRLHSGSIRK